MSNYDTLYRIVLKGDFNTPAERFADVSFVKDAHTFYIVGTDLYIGDKKITNGADLADAVADIAQNASDISSINTTLTKLENTEETSGSIRNIVKSYLDAVDVTEFALASESNGVVTIKGIKQVDSAIAVGTDSNNDVVFDKVATTGAAEDLDYDNTESGLTATDVQSAIDEIASASAGGVGSKTVYVVETSGSGSDAFSKKYSLYQGATGSAASPVVGEKLVDINIPKDMVVEDGEVVDITYNTIDGKLYDGVTDVTALIVGTSGTATAANAGKYIKLTIANADSNVLYIAAKDLVDIYTAEQSATQIQLSIDSNNVISATVVAGSITATELASDAVTTAKILDENVTLAKLASGVQTSLGLADSAVQSVTASDPTTGTNGTITVDGSEVAVKGLGSAAFTDSTAYDAAGAAAAVLGESTDAATANTVYGAKAAAAAAQTDVDNLETLVGTIPGTSEATTVIGYVDEQVAAATGGAIEDLDVTEFALAEKDGSTNVITVHGILEQDGEIAVGSTAANDVVFAAVAGTGAAADVSIADAGNYTSQTTVEGALQEIYGKLQWAEI